MPAKCPKCDLDNPSDSKFCKECGAQLLPSMEIPEVTKTLETPAQELRRGTKFAGRYEIVEKLGTGGMGSVYRVEDTKIHEDVALKLIRPEIAADKKTIERFSNELKLARKIRHKNVSGMYDLGEAEGTHYITMEYISGEDLKSFIKRAAPVSIERAKSIAKQICEGLTEAHKLGIIHRDLKPSNIMIDKAGNTQIMDFGIARSIKAEVLTGADVMIGTPDYMSPEQVEGKDIDYRSDIYSLGVVLFEMLTGERPFKGDTSLSVAMKHKSEAPPNPKWLNDQIPDSLSRLVLKCLEKEKERRYQSAEELLSALNSIDEKKLHIADKEEKKKSIVVLPFENLSPDPEQEYFCDGMTEEIISDLSNVQALRVISRSSALTFKGTKKKIRDIAKDVNVQYVLEGSVRKAGNNLRITAQLIEAVNDVHLWAEKYRGTLDDVFDIQEKVSRSIVDELKLKLSAEEKQRITERPLKNVRAYECYLRAKHEIDTFTKEGVDRAIQHLETGIEIIGESAILYAGLGYAYWQHFNMGSEEQYLNKGLTYGQKALELDRDSSEGHFVIGILSFFHETPRNMKKIIFHLKRALELDPNNCEALFHLEVVYLFLGKTAATAPLVEKHLSIDPLSFYGCWSASILNLFEGRLSQALELMTRTHQLVQAGHPIVIFYVLTLAYNNRFEEAFSVIDQSVKANPDSNSTQLCVILKYALQGKKKETLQSITPQILKWSRIDFTNPWCLVTSYSLTGEKEEALNWLEEWINLGCINYPFLNEYDPFLENIRGEPRFKKLMERVKHEWENFEV